MVAAFLSSQQWKDRALLAMDGHRPIVSALVRWSSFLPTYKNAGRSPRKSAPVADLFRRLAESRIGELVGPPYNHACWGRDRLPNAGRTVFNMHKEGGPYKAAFPCPMPPC